MIYPRPLKTGDKIVILSPASPIKHEYVDAACRVFREWGYEPVVSKHCKGRTGTYSGTLEERLADFKEALADDDVRAILCSRGGYGAVHLVEYLSDEELSRDPKWVIGFSDISVLHASMVSAGVVSLHAPMAKQFAEMGKEDECIKLIHSIITGNLPEYNEPAHKLNRNGEASGQLVGGNLAVLCGLVGADRDILKEDKILFIEDVEEEIYSIERMLYNLRLNGTLANLRGLIVGQFTESKKSCDENGDTMNDMIHRMVAPYGYPVAFNFPIGHIDRNVPLIEGAEVKLSVTPDGTNLQFIK